MTNVIEKTNTVETDKSAPVLTDLSYRHFTIEIYQTDAGFFAERRFNARFGISFRTDEFEQTADEAMQAGKRKINLHYID